MKILVVLPDRAVSIQFCSRAGGSVVGRGSIDWTTKPTRLVSAARRTGHPEECKNFGSIVRPSGGLWRLVQTDLPPRWGELSTSLLVDHPRCAGVQSGHKPRFDYSRGPQGNPRINRTRAAPHSWPAWTAFNDRAGLAQRFPHVAVFETAFPATLSQPLVLCCAAKMDKRMAVSPVRVPRLSHAYWLPAGG